MLSQLDLLVASSNDYIASLSAGMLRNIGAKSVAVVGDSAAVLRALRNGKFDALLIDGRIAPLDGITLVRNIRASGDERFRHVPIILMCSTTDRPRVAMARDAGATEVVRIPTSAKTLALRIDLALKKPREFVDAPGYVGPDRRRRTAEFGEQDRRGTHARLRAESPE